jgi:hypothetical protein
MIVQTPFWSFHFICIENKTNLREILGSTNVLLGRGVPPHVPLLPLLVAIDRELEKPFYMVNDLAI